MTTLKTFFQDYKTIAGPGIKLLQAEHWLRMQKNIS